MFRSSNGVLATALCVGLQSALLAAQIQPVATEGATRSQTAANAVSTPASDSGHEIVLGPGDLVQMDVFGVPELTTKVRVESNGKLSLPLIGDVPVQGLSTQRAQASIEAAFVEGNFLRSPHVTLSILEYTTQGISVMGEVSRPGIYPLLGSRRLYDVIASAGGTTPKAGRLVTLTRRTDPQNPIRVEFSDDPARSMQSNVEVLPGDTVVISRAGVIYVVGEVEKPGGYIMDNNGRLSILQAIALAQGPTKLARLDKARLIRKTETGMQEISVDLKEILTAKKPDQQLLADDIVFLPASPGKNATRRTMEAIIQSATGLAIYGPLR